MLTDKQIKAIHNLPQEDLLQLMHECAEALGCVSIEECCDVLNLARRTVYEYMQSGKIKCLELNGHKYPLVNYKVNYKVN